LAQENLTSSLLIDSEEAVLSSHIVALLSHCLPISIHDARRLSVPKGMAGLRCRRPVMGRRAEEISFDLRTGNARLSRIEILSVFRLISASEVVKNTFWTGLFAFTNMDLVACHNLDALTPLATCYETHGHPPWKE
jgi:hypothetical protein